MTLNHWKRIGIFLSLVLSGVASADWQAKMITRVGQSEGGEIIGKIAVKGQKVRLDVSIPTEMSIIHDQKTRESSALIHSAKIRLEGGFEEYQDRVPTCISPQPEACFVKMGLKKVRTESIDGESTEVYQGKITRKLKGKSDEYDLTIWHPVGMKEVPAIKTVIESAGRDRIETRFTEVSVKEIPATQFIVPKEYVNAGGMDQILKGLKSFGGG